MRRPLRRTGHDAFFHLGFSGGVQKLGSYRTHYDGHVPRNLSASYDIIIRGSAGFSALHIEDRSSAFVSLLFILGFCDYKNVWMDI